MEKVNYNEEDLNDHHAIAAVIKNSSGEILVQDHVKYNFWTIPIGKAIINQTPEEALKQEIFEECNLIIEDFKELISKEYIYERNGKNVKLISHVFEITKYSGNLENKESEKHRKQIFMKLEDIKKIPYLSDATVLYLESIGFVRNAKI